MRISAITMLTINWCVKFRIRGFFRMVQITKMLLNKEMTVAIKFSFSWTNSFCELFISLLLGILRDKSRLGLTDYSWESSESSLYSWRILPVRLNKTKICNENCMFLRSDIFPKALWHLTHLILTKKATCFFHHIFRNERRIVQVNDRILWLLSHKYRLRHFNFL